jgi:hypothetical protein
MKYARHVEELVKKHRLKVKWIPLDRGYHNAEVTEDRVLHLYPVKSARTYAIAMHEIGHVVTRTLHQPVLFKEAAAWQWAKENALEWTKLMQQMLVIGLRSHVQRADVDYQQNKPRQMALPPPEHVFWELAKEIPEAQKLLEGGRARWLAKHLPVVPWGNVLSHPKRPRCETCYFWKSAVALPGAVKEKRAWGICRHKDTPLGIEMTPGGALCGSSWMAI